MRSLSSLFLFLLATPCIASVDYVSVKHCRDLFFGKINEEKVQQKVNELLKEALNKAFAKEVFSIKYGNDESGLFRSKNNACIIATAWFSK